MKTLEPYWRGIAAVVTFLATVLGLVTKWQTVRKNRREEKAQAAAQQRSHVGIAFESIRLDSNERYWREWKAGDSGQVAPRTRVDCQECKQFFSIGAVVSHADPSFDIILRNDAPQTLSVLSFGVRVVRVAHYTYELPIAGEIEMAQKLRISEAYSIEMPNIFSEVRKFDFDEDDPPVDLDRLISKNCEPYLVPPEGRFRYTLTLNNYTGMPNQSIIRLWVGTSQGTQESSDLYLRYGNVIAW